MAGGGGRAGDRRAAISPGRRRRRPLPSGAALLCTALTLLVLTACATDSRPGADLVLRGGVVWTGDGERPRASAVAVNGNRIVAVGDDFTVGEYIGSGTEVVELDGRWVGPGFIDNHTHFDRAGELLLGVNLLEVSDARGLVAEVEATARRLPEGAWMVGGMWGAYAEWAMNSTGESEGEAGAMDGGAGSRSSGGEPPDGGTGRGGADLDPDRSLIDPVSPDNPALLWKWDRSRHLANTAALEAAGADCSWAGVECVDGVPTGRLTAEAASRIRDAIPEKTPEQRLAEARAALADLARHGVTTFFDITPPAQVGVYHELRRRGELTARVNMRLVIDTYDEMVDAGIVEGFGDDWIRYQGLKGFVDGIMGSSQARFYEPYLTTGVRGAWRDASNTGHVTDGGSGMEPEGNMEELVVGADAAGFNPRVHAIGDQAIDSIMDIFARAIEANGARRDRRFAIIHNQVIRGPETARRQAQLGLIAEMQPYHTIDDMRWMKERIGERARWAYAFRTLQEAGVLLSFGSDWPGTNAAWYTVNPLLGMYAAVTRMTLDGTPEGGWYPEERIEAETALRAYTVNNAWVGMMEDRLGQVKEDFLADLVVLDRNPLEVDPVQLKDVQVDMTVVDGEIVFVREGT